MADIFTFQLQFAETQEIFFIIGKANVIYYNMIGRLYLLRKGSMMEDNIFLKNRKELSLADYMKAQENGRENLGTELPVAVYKIGRAHV